MGCVVGGRGETYMPYKWQALQVRQCQENRKDSPYSPRCAISRGSDKCKEDVLAVRWIRRQRCDRSSSNDDAHSVCHRYHAHRILQKRKIGTRRTKKSQRQTRTGAQEAVGLMVLGRVGTWRFVTIAITSPAEALSLMGLVGVVRIRECRCTSQAALD